MIKRKVLLKTMDDVQNFVKATVSSELDVTILSGRYEADAKSVLGLLGMNRNDPAEIHVHADGEAAEKYIKSIEEYIVSEE